MFIFVRDLKPTMLTESGFCGFTFLAVINTTVGTVELVFGNDGEIILVDDLINDHKAQFHQGSLDDMSLTPPGDDVHTAMLFQYTIGLHHPRKTELVIVIGSKHVARN